MKVTYRHYLSNNFEYTAAFKGDKLVAVKGRKIRRQR